MEATLTFTRTQTRRVEGTCTHKHLASLPDSHSGGQRTHSHALTENGKTTHSHVPTRGKNTLTSTLSHLVSLPDSHSPRGTAHAFSRSHREWKDNPLSRSHSGEKQTHFYFLTWFHSVILTQGDNARILTLSQRMESCLLYTSPSPRDQRGSRMPSSA